MAASIAVALVQSRLDYANSILYQTTAKNIHKLQRVQNMAARLVIHTQNVFLQILLSLNYTGFLSPSALISK